MSEFAVDEKNLKCVRKQKNLSAQIIMQTDIFLLFDF